MMDKKWVVAFVLCAVVSSLILSSGEAQTYATNVTSRVQVLVYISIVPSDGLVQIDFGTVNPGTTDHNATNNTELDTCSVDCIYKGNTSYNITVSEDSNVNVDFCVNANDSLRSGANYIALANYNYTWNATKVFVVGAAWPLNDSQVSQMVVQPSWAQRTESNNTAPGSTVHYRFWLKVPTAQAPGTYLNRVNLTAVETGDPCP
jgi:hypothetical protein